MRVRRIDSNAGGPQFSKASQGLARATYLEILTIDRAVPRHEAWAKTYAGMSCSTRQAADAQSA